MVVAHGVDPQVGDVQVAVREAAAVLEAVALVVAAAVVEALNPRT